jgi:NhaP-type Na+/H+ or K+/H+ antiporter
MIPTIQILVLLLIVIAAVSVIASRLKIPPAILLVITGVILAVIPGLPTVKLAPEFVHLGASGVLATVTAGLYISWNVSGNYRLLFSGHAQGPGPSVGVLRPGQGAALRPG